MSREGLPARRSRFRDRSGLDAWSTLLCFFNLMREAVAAVLEPLNLSDDELLVLVCLAHADGDLSMGTIERASFLQAGRLRQAVDKLEGRRLIAWQRSRADRRKVLVRMQRAGRQLVESLAPVMFDLVHRMVEPLGEDGTEFMRAKMRKVLSSATVDLKAAALRLPCDVPDLVPSQLGANELEMRSSQRPPTWGLAGWLRWCQWSSHVDRIWRSKFGNAGLTVPRLQVLAALSGTADAMTVDAIASATGLPQDRLTSTLSVLERGGLVAGWGDKTTPGARLARLTPRGEQTVLEALPMANALADELYRGLSNEDLERVLSLVDKVCGAAWQVRHHYYAAQSLPSTAPAR